MKTLDEMKAIAKGEICPDCEHAYIEHSIECGCEIWGCSCSSNHPQATRKALSDAIQQIAQLEEENGVLCNTISLLKNENERMMKLAHDYITAYEKLAFGDAPPTTPEDTLASDTQEQS